jgi:hypothetical protein
MNEDDFSAYPLSVGELKSDSSGDGSQWTPRDVLVKMLRMIDSGEASPDVLVVAWGEHVNGRRQADFWQSTPDGLLSLGLMQATIFEMQG